jgi:hypothetical protein
METSAAYIYISISISTDPTWCLACLSNECAHTGILSNTDDHGMHTAKHAALLRRESEADRQSGSVQTLRAPRTLFVCGLACSLNAVQRRAARRSRSFNRAHSFQKKTAKNKARAPFPLTVNEIRSDRIGTYQINRRMLMGPVLPPIERRRGQPPPVAVHQDRNKAAAEAQVHKLLSTVSQRWLDDPDCSVCFQLACVVSCVTCRPPRLSSALALA